MHVSYKYVQVSKGEGMILVGHFDIFGQTYGIFVRILYCNRLLNLPL